MSLKLDDCRHRLITKVLFASSQSEVRRYCEATVKELESQLMNGSQISRFLEKTIHDLQQFNPMNKAAQQWSNIVSAKVFCKRLMRQYSISDE
jgi:hypothetical protein